MNRTWTADVGNGTYRNPLFFDEFSDPDLIRVGEDYYLTGTTMHAFPGLPVLHSRDLVNWRLLSYACDRLDFGPEYRLEGGRDVYGQGIWAPCFRHHKGTFYIFTNVNGRATQVFTSTNPAGPWSRREMKRGFHDLSVLFDDDGLVYVVWGYRDLRVAQLNEALDDILPETEHAPFGKDSVMGEGAHFTKIDGRYFITSAWYAGRMRMPCARAHHPYGPYEILPEISADEAFGLTRGWRLRDAKTLAISEPDASGNPGGIAMHQGGIVDTPEGEWWGFSMMDANSVGRLTCLSPVTWQDGWPYFGLPGNLGRSPGTWVKPSVGKESEPFAPYDRDDSFAGPRLGTVWQWNHVPVDDRWSLEDRPGYLRLKPLPADDFWHSRNTLTQRAVGPASTVTVEIDASALGAGATAGLGLLNLPYAWIGYQDGAVVAFDQLTGTTIRKDAPPVLWLRAECDFLEESARLSFSTDGIEFTPLLDKVRLVYGLRTFQGVRYALFAYGGESGHADFRNFRMQEPERKGIPLGETWSFEEMGSGVLLRLDGKDRFVIADRGRGRVMLETDDGRCVTVRGPQDVVLAEPTGDDAQAFQWTEVPRGDVLLMSLATHRHLRLTADGKLFADEPGAHYHRRNGASFRLVKPK